MASTSTGFTGRPFAEVAPSSTFACLCPCHHCAFPHLFPPAISHPPPPPAHTDVYPLVAAVAAALTYATWASFAHLEWDAATQVSRKRRSTPIGAGKSWEEGDPNHDLSPGKWIGKLDPVHIGVSPKQRLE